MQKDSLIGKVMHFVIHNSFLFTVAVMCLVHMTLLGIMCLAEVYPLIYLNIMSVVVYLFCILLCKMGQIVPVYVSILLEVSVYAIISVRLIGWHSGSFCFLCSIIPIIIYFGCFIFKKSKRWAIVLLLALEFAIYSTLYLVYEDAAPSYEIPIFVRNILFIFSSFVMTFSIIFYNAIYIQSSEFEMNTLEQKNEQLSVDAYVDTLTGLLNRRGFLPKVKELMVERERHHFCIAFCDIDNFKRINDSYGHDCGDEVLRHISRSIKKEMYGCDICRWGGEEIIILMKDYDFEVAKQKMEYIRNYIETTPTVFYNKRISATITIGVEECKDEYQEPEEIIRVADDRMYYGKQHGKNIVIYES